MLSLIKKDIALEKSNIFFMIAFLIVVIFAMESFPNSTKCFLYMTTIVFSLSITTFAYDEKSKGEYVINSLPVSKKEIVYAKYVSVLIYTVFVIILTALISMILNLPSMPHHMDFISLNAVKTSFIAIMLMSAFSFPFFFEYGYVKGRIISTAIYFLIFLCTLILTLDSDKTFLKTADFILKAGVIRDLLFIFMAAAIFIISMIISVFLYEKRDL